MGVALPWWGAAIARDRRSRKLRHTLCSRQARRMLQAIADGENNPEALAGLADRRLRGHPGATMRCARRVPELHPIYRRLIKMMLEELKVSEEHTAELNQELATLLHPQQDAVERLAEVPGLGVESAQQILAEVGAKAATFASAKNLCSWVGACPGEEESAGVN